MIYVKKCFQIETFVTSVLNMPLFQSMISKQVDQRAAAYFLTGTKKQLKLLAIRFW